MPMGRPRVPTHALATAGLDRIYGLNTPLYHGNGEGRTQTLTAIAVMGR